MKKAVFGFAIFLAIIHQDFWWWDNKELQLGFIPTGLFFHSIFSCLAAATWFAATKWAWPSDIEAWAETSGEPQDSSNAEPSSKEGSES